MQFSTKSPRYAHLLDVSLKSVHLESSDVEQLYAICDYGTLSTIQTPNASDAGTIEVGLNGIVYNACAEERSPATDFEYLSGHISSTTLQDFHYTGFSSMLSDFSGILSEFSRADASSANYS